MLDIREARERRADHWVCEYETIVEHYFWIPQRLNRAASPRRMPWDEVWRRLGHHETPLNHLLNVFFRLAPHSLTREVLGTALGDFPFHRPALRGMQQHAVTGICQPDFVFADGDHLAFMEMKVTASLGIEQVAKYALTAAALQPAGEIGLICLGPAPRLGGADQFIQRRSAGQPVLTGKLLRWADKLKVERSRVEAAVDQLSIATLSFRDLYEVLARDLLKAPDSDETRRRLVAGMMVELEVRGLATTA